MNAQLRKTSDSQNFVLLLNLFCLFILNSSLFCYLVLYLLLCPLLCLLLFFILDSPLFYCLIVYLLLFLVLDLPLFYCLVICPLLFFVAEFQFFYHRFLCLVYLFFLDLYLSEHSNNPYQRSLGPACQPALQSPFVHSRFLIRIIRTIIAACTIRPIITNASGVLILHSSTLVYWPTIIIKKRRT